MSEGVKREQPLVICFATQGAGHREEQRISSLLDSVAPVVWPFDRGKKAKSGWRLFRELVGRRPDLVVMEGTGVAGGLAVLAARLLVGVRYVVSSGDAVGPYIGLNHRALAPVAAAYERALCRWSAGFIGWTPYLVGRALTFGAPRAMTAAGWSDLPAEDDRERRRDELGIPADAIVFGLAGTLDWAPAVNYCYGLELVKGILAVERDDLRVVIFGDGSGRKRLEDIAAGDERVILPGRVPKETVPGHLAALDVASLPQSTDGVGSFRYTTKISEYLAAGLPVVTSEIPLGYDLDGGWIWRLSGNPWERRYVDAMARLMRNLTRSEIEERRRRVPREDPIFDRGRQERRVAAFVNDLLEK